MVYEPERRSGRAAPSDPDVIGCRALATLVARVGDTPWLYQQQLHLSFGAGLVPGPLGLDEHLARSESHCAVLEVDSQRSLEDDESLVGILMVVPDEVTVDPHDLELVVIHLRDDLGLPLVGEQLEFLLQVDRSIAHGTHSEGKLASRITDARRR